MDAVPPSAILERDFKLHIADDFLRRPSTCRFQSDDRVDVSAPLTGNFSPIAPSVNAPFLLNIFFLRAS